VSTEPGNEPNLLIDGKWVAASGGTYEIINPATEQVVGHAPNATADDALAAAKSADAIRAKAPELLPLVIADTGATLAVGSGMQVPVAADRFNRYARDFRSPGRSPLQQPTSARSAQVQHAGVGDECRDADARHQLPPLGVELGEHLLLLCGRPLGRPGAVGHLDDLVLVALHG